MSSTISPGYGVMPQLIASSTNTHQQLDNLTLQVSSGLVSQTYAGLGGNADVSLNLSPQIDALKASQANIDQATGSMAVSQAALTQIQTMASTFFADMPDLNGLSGIEVDTVASQANSALQQLAGLLDTQDGSNYVFGGQDSLNPPVPSPDNILSSGFYTQINAAVAALSTNGGTATAATTLSVASSNSAGTSPFSAYMSQPVSSIATTVAQTGEGAIVQTGLLASGNSVAVSAGTSTTGSYMRDLMRALATLGSLSSSQMTDPGFGALVQDTGASLSGAVTAMATDVGVLGNTQASLTATQTQLGDTSTALSAQLSSVQDVNMAAALSSLTGIQTQLQASYKLITAENGMSLVNFLPT